MTDASFSSASLRIQRGRNPSSQSRTPHYDEGSLRLPSNITGGAGGQNSLRSVSSRISLSEHFAATRSLYEFGFDDASSYAAPSVMMNEPTGATVEGSAVDMTALTVEEKERVDIEAMLEGDFYDILCLPREMVTREDIRRAYHRMFLLFYPETYPEAMQAIAKRQFERAQDGFEVLIDEGKRRAYDRAIGRASDEDDEDIGSRETGNRTEVGVRVDTSNGLKACHPLDFTVGHSSSIVLPSLAHPILTTNLSTLGLTTTTPSLTLSSSIYGIIPPMSAFPIHLLSSPHQPLRPATSPRHRLLHLVESKLSPVIGAQLTHEIANASSTASNSPWLGTRAEYGLDVLPNLAPSIRLFHHLRDATILETSIRGRSLWSSSDEAGTPPRAAIGVHRSFPLGTGFARVDSGDWTFTPETYRFLTSANVPQASTLSYADFPLKVCPSVELGLTTGDGVPGSAAWTDGLEGTGRELSALNYGQQRTKSGAWTASATVQPINSLTTSVRYTAPPIPSLSSTNLEIDLSTGTLHPSNLALRHLFPLTNTTSIGLELSLSRFSTHLSLHFSRLNQRVSLPLLFPPIERLQSRTLFLASALPFLALAAFKFLSRRSRSKRNRTRGDKTAEVLDTSSPVVQAAIARRREEADHLTGLLAHPVATRQKHHASQGNLVIISAKFGLAASSPDTSNPSITLNSTTPSLPVSSMTFHPDEEIADVTVALAALVDDQTGGLWIPAKVRKGCIPGFWDPAPGRETLLLVRYSWKGKEAVAAVSGEEELILPPR